MDGLMARRYIAITRPRGDWLGAVDATDYLARTVYEAEPSPRATGLFDASGTELYAVDEVDPVGFVRLKERA